jgi:hypothetical protein
MTSEQGPREAGMRPAAIAARRRHWPPEMQDGGTEAH